MKPPSPARNSLFNRPIQVPPARFRFVEVCSWPLLAFFAWALAAGWFAGFSTRMMGDDYFFGFYMRRDGFWGSWVTWYHMWYGRWFSQIVMNLVFSFNDWIVILVPTLLLTMWAASLASAIHCLTQWPRALIVQTIIVVLGLTLTNIPHIIESLYWAASSLFHTLPLALCGFIVPGLWGRSTSPFRLAGTTLLAFCLSGSSETFTVVWAPLLAFIALWRRDKYSIWACLGAIAGALLMLLAPGNAVRASMSAPHWEVTRILLHSWALTKLFLLPLFKGALYAAVMWAFVMGLRHGTGRLVPRWFHLVVCVAFIYFVAFATQAPSVYASGRIPVGRVMIIPTFFVSAAYIWGGFVFGALCKKFWCFPAPEKTVRFTFAGALLLLVSAFWLGPIVPRPWGQVAVMQDFQRDWTARDRAIRQQIANGQRVVVAKHIGSNATIAADVEDDPNYYANSFMASYYSPNFYHPVKIIRAKD